MKQHSSGNKIDQNGFLAMSTPNFEHPSMRQKELYSTATTVGAERVGAKDTWVVELKPKGSDKVHSNYHDKATRLLVQSKMQGIAV
jgi:hypothetical protein